VSEIGEQFGKHLLQMSISHFDPTETSERLQRCSCKSVEQLGGAELMRVAMDRNAA
jgi:hypothetical protein